MYLIKYKNAVKSCESLEVLWNLDFIQDKFWIDNLYIMEDLRRSLETGKKLKIDDITVWKRILKKEGNE